MAHLKLLSKQVADWLTERKVKAFYYPIVAENLRQGVKSLLQVSGIGKLRPNILLMGYKKNWQSSDVHELNDYFALIQ